MKEYLKIEDTQNGGGVELAGERLEFAGVKTWEGS